MREWSPLSEEALRMAHLPGFFTLLFSACLLQQVAVREALPVLAESGITAQPSGNGAKTSIPVFVMLPVFN
jgi:hypothetical protein